MTRMADPQEPQAPKPITITIATLTHMFGYGRTTAFSLIAQGRLERVKIGRRTLVTMASAEALIAQAASGTDKEGM